MKKKLILLLVGIFLIYWYQVSKVDDEFQLPIFTPSDLRQTLVHPDLVGKTTHEIPNFSFTNQNGNIVNQASVRNKIYIANFFFTSCPSICIDLTKNLKLVQNAFDPEDIIILSHSVDPQIDSVDRLKKYEELNDINGKNWFFLRGDINEVIKMAQLGYFAIASVDNHIENSLIHTENIVLVDKESKIRGVYNGTSQLEMSYLISDVNKLLNR